ncbi:MAG: DnaK suppressor protein-like protein, partial [Candidatus Kaiserbacteria bacterium GW2011_GWC2_52_8b]
LFHLHGNARTPLLSPKNAKVETEQASMDAKGLLRILGHLKDAIEKIDRGTYGLCEECDGPIPLARIKVNPSARTCLEHAE